MKTKEKGKKGKEKEGKQCCGSGMFIPDPES
jgi:hypothetical protein